MTRRDSAVLLLIVWHFTQYWHLLRWKYPKIDYVEHILSHQNSDGKRDVYISHYHYFLTGIVPKSFRKKSKSDPDHGENMRREHTCCTVNIYV